LACHFLGAALLSLESSLKFADGIASQLSSHVPFSIRLCKGIADDRRDEDGVHERNECGARSPPEVSPSFFIKVVIFLERRIMVERCWSGHLGAPLGSALFVWQALKAPGEVAMSIAEASGRGVAWVSWRDHPRYWCG